MARKPRPIDPAAGPLQAFAHDLRLVREQAGNPTYRALATTAGFGATTLSDAAGGVRAPSLEVTLAYVGACGGDTAEWEARWRELNRVLNDQRVAEARESESAADPGALSPVGADGTARGTAGATGASEPSDQPEPPDGATVLTGPEPPERRWWPSGRRGTVTTVLAAAAVVAVLAALLPLLLHGKPKTDALACGPMPPSPTAKSEQTGFVGVTYGAGAHVHSGASLNAAITRTVPPGCRLHLTGFCLGDVVFDPTGGAPDIRWFEVYGGGVVASAIIHGNPPSNMALSSCPADAPMPSGVGLSVARSANGADALELQATGNHVGIIGYAALYTNVPPTPVGTPAGTPTGASSPPAGTPTWHQLQMVGSPSSNFFYQWPLSGLGTGGGAAQPITVAAVACLGGGGPTDAIDARIVPAPGTAQAAQPAQPAQLTPDQLNTAKQAACRYPNSGSVTNRD